MALVQCDITRFANHFFASDSLTVRFEARIKSGIDFCRVIGPGNVGNLIPGLPSVRFLRLPMGVAVDDSAAKF